MHEVQAGGRTRRNGATASAPREAGRLVKGGEGDVPPARRATGAGRGLWRLVGGAAVALLSVIALATRVVNLDRYSGSYPEGVRAEQLLLMSLGYRPFRDIFSDQGPWLLDVLYPGFALFGPNLVGVRAVVVAASLVGLAATGWLAYRFGGPLAGLASLGLLVASPTYLKFSRLSVAEPVALAAALLALVAAVRFGDSGRGRWLVGAGTLLGVSLLIKPISLGVGPAVALVVLLGPRRWRSLMVLASSVSVTVLGGVLVVGLPEVVSQIFLFRWQSRAVEGWSLATNLARAGDELGAEGLAFCLLGGLGLILALGRRLTWPLAVWASLSVATVLVHSPLHAKHFTLIVVPAALLGGLALARAASWSAVLARRPAGLAIALAGVVLLGLYLVELPRLLARDHEALTARDLFDRDASIHWYDDAIKTLAETTGPGSFVVTDHPYLAFAAGRPVPPFLAEASAVRVRAGTLNSEQMIEHTRRFNSRAVLLWADKLTELRRYRAWLQQEYVLARVWATQDDTRPELWLARDGDLERQRAALRSGSVLGPPEPLDGRLRAVSWGLDRTRAGPAETAGVTIEWEAVQGVPADTLVELSLRTADGRIVEEEREPLLGGRTVVLEPGWWMSWVGGIQVPPGLEPGSYQVVVRLRDRVNRRLGSEVPVGVLEVEAAAR